MLRVAAIGVLALGLVMLRACAWVLTSDAGSVVRVSLASARWPDRDGPGLLPRADGAEVRIERALLTWSRVTLEPCAPSKTAWRSAQAHAHSSTSPLVVERSRVVSLLGPAATELATLEAPSGHYCRVVVSFEGAASDARGAPPDVAMQGRTLHLDGYFRASAEAPWQALELDETAAFEVAITLGDDARGIELADGRALELTLSVEPALWFDGVTPGASDSARRALENVRESLALELE